MDRTTAVSIWREICGNGAFPPTGRVLEKYAERIAAAEREACAKHFDDGPDTIIYRSEAAAAIRARNKHLNDSRE